MRVILQVILLHMSILVVTSAHVHTSTSTDGSDPKSRKLFAVQVWELPFLKQLLIARDDCDNYFNNYASVRSFKYHNVYLKLSSSSLRVQCTRVHVIVVIVLYDIVLQCKKSQNLLRQATYG